MYFWKGKNTINVYLIVVLYMQYIYVNQTFDKSTTVTLEISTGGFWVLDFLGCYGWLIGISILKLSHDFVVLH